MTNFAAEPTPYERIGGAPGVEKLVHRFYDLMDEIPEVRELRAMHPEDLGGSRQKLIEFMSGWLGGPQLYVERRGHPRLRMRHMPFRVDKQARDAWLRCMLQALDEADCEDLLKQQLRGSLARLADHMRNVEEA